MGFAEFSDQDSRWFSFCFHRQSCPKNRSIPAVTKGLKSGDRIGYAQYDGRSKIERNEIFFMTVMVADRTGTSASRILTACGKRYREVPSFCSIGTILPSRPAHNQCRRAQRRSRMARLRATASAARSVLDGREHGGTLGRVGIRSTPIQPSKSAHARPSKTEITLNCRRRRGCSENVLAQS